jgi:hypothetical protein
MEQLRLDAPPTVVADYFHLFVNRRAYTLQSNRPHPESARHYYYRPTNKKTGQGLSLTLDKIRRHLEGEITIGLYSINPATQCSKGVAIEADYEDALADLLKLSFYLKQDGVESALEKSHRGGHLWIFMAEPLSARDCRIYVCGLALRLGIPVKGGRQREGIEVFPKHDALKPGRYSNPTVDPVVQEVLRAQAQHALEGVTFSGGEPMQQADSLLPLIQRFLAVVKALRRARHEWKGCNPQPGRLGAGNRPAK